MKAIKIYKLKGKKSIEIEQMDESDWFYSIKHLDAKKKVVERGMIVKSQIPLWTEKFIESGYLVDEKDI